MAIYLIDYENVHEYGLEGVKDLPDGDRVVVFYGNKIKSISFDVHVEMMNSKAVVEYIETHKTAKNYLDFQLSTYLGYLIGRGMKDNVVIVSRDTGFDSVVDFWTDHGTKICRREYITVQPQPEASVKSSGMNGKVQNESARNDRTKNTGDRGNDVRSGGQQQKIGVKADAAVKAEKAAASEKVKRAEKTPSVKQPEAVKKANAAKQPEGVKKANAAKQPEGVKKANAAKQPEGMKKADVIKQPEGMKKADVVKQPEGVKKADAVKPPEAVKKTAAAKQPEAVKKAEEMKTSVSIKQETEKKDVPAKKEKPVKKTENTGITVFGLKIGRPRKRTVKPEAVDPPLVEKKPEAQKKNETGAAENQSVVMKQPETSGLPDTVRTQICDVLHENALSGEELHKVYDAVLESRDKLMLNNTLVKAYGNDKGGDLYNQIRRIFVEYRKTAEVRK